MTIENESSVGFRLSQLQLHQARLKHYTNQERGNPFTHLQPSIAPGEDQSSAPASHNTAFTILL